MPIISLSLSDKLLDRFDDVLSERGYSSRSEAFREAIRAYLMEYEWKDGVGEGIIAIIVLLHDKKTSKETLSLLHHEYEDIVRAMMHMHLDETNCLVIFVTKGNGKRIRELIDRIKPIKGTKRVGFVTAACEI
jgi:CopG family nickel-responsive transcriptional regulator